MGMKAAKVKDKLMRIAIIIMEAALFVMNQIKKLY